MKSQDGIIGFVVGDALGVPYEGKSRNALKNISTIKMKGYGTHNQPKGYWSDDSSMTFCTIESIIDKNEICYEDIMDKFSQWYNNGYWTPNNEIFDIGITTSCAIETWDFNGSILPINCGATDKYSNGNGSLMRMLPIAYYFHKKGYRRVRNVFTYSTCCHISALTHGNALSKNCCVLYVDMALNLLNGGSVEESFNELEDFVNLTLKNDIRLFSCDFKKLPESEIKSTGYVIHTLESVMWVLLNSSSYKEAISKAIKLGNDTDTIGALVGGLAGIYYGLNSIPKEWIDDLARKNDIYDLCNKFNNM